MGKKFTAAAFVEFESLVSISEKAFKIMLLTGKYFKHEKSIIIPKSHTIRVTQEGVWVTLWLLSKMGIPLRKTVIDFLEVRDKQNKYFKRGNVEIVRYTPKPVEPVKNNTISALKK